MRWELVSFHTVFERPPGVEGFVSDLNGQIPIAKQCNDRILTDQIRSRKIPNLKALFPKVLFMHSSDGGT